jgi:ATP-binding cassette, subfamily B, bacterial
MPSSETEDKSHSPPQRMERSWREAWRRTRALLGLLRYVGPQYRVLLFMVLAVSALVPSIEAALVGHIVSQVSDGYAEDAEPLPLTQLLPSLSILLAVLLAAQLANSREGAARYAIRRQVDERLRFRLRATVNKPSTLRHLEDSATQDAIASVVPHGSWLEESPGAGLVAQCALLSRYLGAVAAASVLAVYSPMLAVAALTVMLAVRQSFRRDWYATVDVEHEISGSKRKVDYLAEIVGSPASARELRTYNLGDWVMERHRAITARTISRMWLAKRRVLRRQSLAFLTTAASALAVFLWPVLAAVHGDLDPGALTAQLLVAWTVLSMGTSVDEGLLIRRSSRSLATLEHLERRFQASEPVSETTGGRDVRNWDLIKFEGVSFSYSEDLDPILDDLWLEIRNGEKVGIVGSNGVGKSTLVKLLAGLYRPTRGRITVDGVPLAEIDMTRWRRYLSVAFQDFIHYDLPIRDNIGLSSPENLGDAASLEESADRVGMKTIVDGLPKRWDTTLSRSYRDGAELSGGQWQRVGLARALFGLRGNGSILVLDEPTSHLDAQAELDLVSEILDGADVRTAIVISHRLTSIRHLDRIVVLRNGRVVEDASHDELVSLGGEYARMFATQAARYRIAQDGASVLAKEAP